MNWDDNEELRKYRREYYNKNKERISATHKAYYESHKEILRKRGREYYLSHKEEFNSNSRKWHSDNRDKTRQQNRELYAEKRKMIIGHYSNGTFTCACCGISDIKFLTIDHIDGGGTRHRKDIPAGKRFFKWLIDNNFPSGFQILCWNCNCGRQYNNGICPHKDNVQ